MLTIMIAMAAVLVIAGLVVAYVALHRGEDTPGAPWLGGATARPTDAISTLAEEETAQRRR